MIVQKSWIKKLFVNTFTVCLLAKEIKRIPGHFILSFFVSFVRALSFKINDFIQFKNGIDWGPFL